MERVIFNTTYHVNRLFAARWLDFFKQYIKPRIEQNVAFSDCRICKVLVGNSPEDETFAVQFYAESRVLLDAWLEKEGHLLDVYMRKTFGENVLTFSVFMEEVVL